MSTFTAISDPGRAHSLDDLAEALQSLKVWAGDPSYDWITTEINDAWTAAGRPVRDLTKRPTVADCFKAGRRRLNTDLILAIVRALHPDEGYIAQWRQALRVIGGETRAAAQVRVHDRLPPDLVGFTGRTAALDQVRRTLHHRTADGRAVVISAIAGMAGVGKTQLAIHAGHLLTAEEPFDRVLFVNLRGFHPDPAQPPADPAAVLDGFLRVLGVPGHQIPHDLCARAAMYRGLLARTRALVVLDNAADADQVRPLLPAGPGCLTLVTSRRDLTDLHPATHLAVDVFTPAEAVQFVLQAASAVPVGEDRNAAARIARRCGYLPLALGLVAGHMRAKPDWTLTDHGDWLDERRHQRRLDTGVELAFSLSYQHLPADQRRLLRLLALHPGQDLDAYAAAALAGTDLDTAARHVADLCGDRMLQQGNPGRYAFHDLIRAYAVTRAHDEDRPAARRAALTRLFDHYLAATVTAMNTLYPANAQRLPDLPDALASGPDLTEPDTARAWLDSERPTLVAVVAHTATNGWSTHAFQLAVALFRYLAGGFHADAVAVHSQAYDAAGRLCDPTGQAHALTNLGVAHARLGRHGLAAEHYERALDLFRQVGNPAGLARTLGNLGIVEEWSGRYRSATNHYRQALTLYRKIGDRTGEARTLANLGDVETLSGRHRPATDHLQQALRLYRQAGNRDGEAWTLDSLGTLHTRRGTFTDATECHRDARTIFRETGDRNGEASAINGLGEAARHAGQPSDALTHHTAALAIATDTGNRHQQARAHTGLGHAHHSLGDTAEARRQYEQALTLYDDLRSPQADRIRAHLTAPDLRPTTTISSQPPLTNVSTTASP